MRFCPLYADTAAENIRKKTKVVSKLVSKKLGNSAHQFRAQVDEYSLVLISQSQPAEQMSARDRINWPSCIPEVTYQHAA